MTTEKAVCWLVTWKRDSLMKCLGQVGQGMSVGQVLMVNLYRRTQSTVGRPSHRQLLLDYLRRAN